VDECQEEQALPTESGNFSSRGLWWWRGGTVEGLVTENFAPRDAEKHNFS